MKECIGIRYVIIPAEDRITGAGTSGARYLLYRKLKRIRLYIRIRKEEMMENNEIYGDFAWVYDTFMDNIPYDEWFAYLHGLLQKYGITEGIVVDIGCGTGILTQKMQQAGYDMIGIDLSEEMLEIARERVPAEVLLLNQDMREMDLYGSAAAMYCICDGMNYMCSAEDFKKVLERVYLFLDNGGIFIFDLKTAYFYEKILGNRTIVDNRENATLIWENEYDTETQINEYLVTIYREAEEDSDIFYRDEELHRQRAYSIDALEKLFKEQLFSNVKFYHAFTEDIPKEDSERIYIIAQK